MAGSETRLGEPLVEPLTRREREFLMYLTQGYSGPEIAQKLSQAVGFVQSSIRRACSKLGVNRSLQAVTRARQLGLLGPAPAVEPQRPTPVPAHNLPRHITRFFGREAELALLPGWHIRPDQRAIWQAYQEGQAMNAERSVADALGEAAL